MLILTGRRPYDPSTSTRNPHSTSVAQSHIGGLESSVSMVILGHANHETGNGSDVDSGNRKKNEAEAGVHFGRLVCGAETVLVVHLKAKIRV